MSKNEQDLSKTEQYRAEREARINALRNKDGSKKRLKQKSNKKRNRAILITVVVVLVIVALIYISWLFGFLQRNLSAVKLGNQNIKVTEYDYTYFSTYNMYNQYFGGGGLLNLREDSSGITGQDKTWGEFFRDTAEKNLRETNVVYQKAAEAGYELDDEANASIDSYFERMKSQAGTPLEYEIYLESAFGRGMNEKVLRGILEKQALAAKFAIEEPQKYELSEDKINEEYEANRADYDLYSYVSYLLITPTKDDDGNDLSSDAVAQKRIESENTAKELTEKVKKPEDLTKLLTEKGLEDKDTFDLSNYMNDKKTGNSISDTEVKDWLSSADRKEGDMTYFESGNNFRILYFISSEKDSRKTADVVFSMFAKRDKDGAELSEDELNKIRTEADKLASELKTEEDFAAYDEKAAEEGTPKAAPHQKAERVDAGKVSSLEDQVLNYILSPEAKEGETKVIETDYGVYLVLVEKIHDTESWEQMISDKMRKDMYSENLKGWLDDPANELHKSYPGYWMAGK